MINVLLVEDHELYRMGLAMLLNHAEGINLIAEASDGLEGVKKAKDFTPNVILMDIGLPTMDGIEATQRIKDIMPEVKILIFTSRESEHDIFESFKAGADGYIMKGASPEQTIQAIKAVNEGVGWIDPAIAKIVFSNLESNTKYLLEFKSLVKQGSTEYNLDCIYNLDNFEIPGYVKASDGKFYKYNYEIIFEDNQMITSKTAVIENKLININKVDVISSFFSAHGFVVAPIAEKHKIFHHLPKQNHFQK